MGEVSGQTVFITGAARGIGAATARTLVRRGAQVALVDVDGTALATVAAELGRAAWHEAVDVTAEDDLRAAVERAVEWSGRLDAVLVNAAVNHIAPVGELSTADFDRVMAVNLGGAVRTVHAVLPHLRQAQGYILFVCSGAGLVQGPFQAAYNASKAGVHALANTLRQELVDEGVQVGVAYFNAVATEAAHTALSHPLMKPLQVEKLMTPRPVEEAADGLVRAFERRSRTVYIPRQARLAAVAPTLLQKATDRWVTRRLGG